MNFCAMSLTAPISTIRISEILIVAEKMLGERIDEFVKDDSVSTRPCVPNGGRRNITVNHLLLPPKQPPVAAGLPRGRSLQGSSALTLQKSKLTQLARYSRE